ncbi:piggyBac transposable element-derived protein 4 [Aplysia californica]|uniref:PiggyBac transposable element-derived protein 4 n=1 Tax=Aplysia californica TaxID=6500 RepID=A0ABM0ZWD7_APLCA|nr:piggyBac transposable element-derived protein 4 [Aplysia californica]
MLDQEWSENLDCYPFVPPFTGEPGLHIPDGVDTPYDFLRLFITDDMLLTLKRETNRYAAKQIEAVGNAAAPFSIYSLWKPVTLNEMRGFFVILLHMSLLDKPRLSDYWNTSPIVMSQFAGNIMGRDRFMQILSFLHISDDTNYRPYGEPGHHPLAKLEPVYSTLRATFQSLYTPERKVSIDEAVCPWRGRLRFRVYMKDKPHKWGIKLYELCESSSGYVYDFEVYAGIPGLSNRPVDVCKRLMTPLLHKGYVLFTDNYYTCPELVDDLAADDTMCVGTVRANRVGMPKDLVNMNLATGEVSFRRRQQVVALKWQDKKPVHLLTTVHDPRRYVTVTTRTTTKDKPEAIQDYVLNMSGVDRSDQLMAYNPFRRRSVKWWKKLFFHLFTMCSVQAQILHNKSMRARQGKTMNLVEFLISAGNAMAEDYVAKRLQDRAQPNNGAQAEAVSLNRLTARHFPKWLPPTPQKEHPFRVCFVCSARKRKAGQPLGAAPTNRQRKETQFWCEPCGKALCPAPCFEIFHTKKDYLL